jgi:enoyl-CoA hydratase/carnithine racemase
MSEPVLLVERPDDSLALLTLNWPERRNALTVELMAELCGTLRTSKTTRKTGAGPTLFGTTIDRS